MRRDRIVKMDKRRSESIHREHQQGMWEAHTSTQRRDRERNKQNSQLEKVGYRREGETQWEDA